MDPGFFCPAIVNSSNWIGETVGTVSCGSVADLRSLTSPHLTTTAGGTNDHATSCGGNGNEAVFSIVLLPGGTIDIGQSTNSYDSRHETRWGGSCPGANVVTCTDDPDTVRHSWTNDQGVAQSVFFVVDAYSTGSGAFTLTWTATGVGTTHVTTGDETFSITQNPQGIQVHRTGTGDTDAGWAMDLRLQCCGSGSDAYCGQIPESGTTCLSCIAGQHDSDSDAATVCTDCPSGCYSDAIAVT